MLGAGLAVPAPPGRGPRAALGGPGPVGLPWPGMILKGHSRPTGASHSSATGIWGSARAGSDLPLQPLGWSWAEMGPNARNGAPALL